MAFILGPLCMLTEVFGEIMLPKLMSMIVIGCRPVAGAVAQPQMIAVEMDVKVGERFAGYVFKAHIQIHFSAVVALHADILIVSCGKYISQLILAESGFPHDNIGRNVLAALRAMVLQRFADQDRQFFF